MHYEVNLYGKDSEHLLINIKKQIKQHYIASFKFFASLIDML